MVVVEVFFFFLTIPTEIHYLIMKVLQRNIFNVFRNLGLKMTMADKNVPKEKRSNAVNL